MVLVYMFHLFQLWFICVCFHMLVASICHKKTHYMYNSQARCLNNLYTCNFIVTVLVLSANKEADQM